MLRAVVKNFLETLSEREFDAPLLALLASKGFVDVHFIHGGFEFGKDVIAKRRDGDSMRQYSIQSKAGDIGQAEWRAVRPQLDECEYNTRAHPGFDAQLPRVAVLVTTGVLKGSAPIDAQEYRAACARRGLADFEVWDQETLLESFCRDPTLGLTDLAAQRELIALLVAIHRRQINESTLERHTRSWLAGSDSGTRLARAAIEAAIIARELCDGGRLDLAALVALHLYRASWVSTDSERDTHSKQLTAASLRLFIGASSDLLTKAAPLLTDPSALARTCLGVGYLITYPALCSRLLELFSLLSLCEPEPEIKRRATIAVAQLVAEHPGTARPPSDQFAPGLLAASVVLLRFNPDLTKHFLRRVSQWLLDSYDESRGGLGLGSLDEDERIQFERLVAGTTTLTSLRARTSSHLAVVITDALWLAGAPELYEAVRSNMVALRITPTASVADERYANWRRGGPDVHVQPRVECVQWDERATAALAAATPLDAVLLSSVARNRHYLAAYASLLATPGSDDAP